MASVGILAHRSMLEGGVPYDVPDFRKEEDRVKFEKDYLSPFYGTNGEKPTIPSTTYPEFNFTEEDMAKYDELMKKL